MKKMIENLDSYKWKGDFYNFSGNSYLFVDIYVCSVLLEFFDVLTDYLGKVRG